MAETDYKRYLAGDLIKGVFFPAQQFRPFPVFRSIAHAQVGLANRQPDSRGELIFYGPEPRSSRIPAWEVLDMARWRIHARRSVLRPSTAPCHSCSE